MSGTEPRWTAEKILAAAVCLHTFALFFDLACPQSLYLPEISSPLTAAALLLRAIKGGRIRTRCLLCAPALLLAAYIALDILSFLRGDLRAFAEKYRVAAVCALNAAGLYISLNDGALAPRGIYLTLCAAGMSAGIAAGVYSDYKDAVSKCVTVTGKVLPDAERTKIYERKFNTYKKIITALDGVWKELRK